MDQTSTSVSSDGELRVDLITPPARDAVDPIRSWYLPLKAVMEWLIAFVLLLPASLVILLAAVLIKLTSRGAAFYCQTRLGKHGRLFTVFKLRTMIDGAEDETGPVWADADDPRITAVGRFLRWTHLDELPQLVNVLLGQMSLVGPRPERPELVDQLEWELKYYPLRVSLRPGITGIAQLRLPPDREVESVRRKLIYDLFYIRHLGPWLDFRILLMTAARFMIDLIATLCRPFWLPAWNTVLDVSPAGLADAETRPNDPQSNPAGNGHRGRPATSDEAVTDARADGPSNTHQPTPPQLLLQSLSRQPSTPANSPAEQITNALTVDVEDYFHVQAFAKYIDRRDWDHYPSRVVANTHRILRMLHDRQVRGTFFILGWVADRHPDLVKDIQHDGHEVGCHSYHHRLIYEMTPDEFRADLKRATEIIGSITGDPVNSFRAPSFSITEESLWALDILAEEGYRHDSSIFPVHHDAYGIPGADRFPHAIQRPAGTLYEFPPSVHRLWKYNLPVAGGGYFRLYPLSLTLYCLRQINRRHNQPFVFYLHPWELDPGQPRLPLPHSSRRDAPDEELPPLGLNGKTETPGYLKHRIQTWKSRFRHYQNLQTTQTKFTRLLQSFVFASVRETFQRAPLNHPTCTVRGPDHTTSEDLPAESVTAIG